jgi:hypothetical protein
MVDHLSRNNCYPKYTFIKRGVYYLSKRVPNDLKHHYKTERITQSLKTKSQHQASRSAAILVSKLEDYWINVRLSEAIVPASHLMNDSPRKTKQPKLPTIRDALELYLKVKGHNKQKLFFSHTRRSVSYLEQCLGRQSLVWTAPTSVF